MARSRQVSNIIITNVQYGSSDINHILASLLEQFNGEVWSIVSSLSDTGQQKQYDGEDS